MPPFGSGRPVRPCVVVNPGGGWASWPQPSSENNFPCAARIPRGTNSFRFQVLHGVATAARCGQPIGTFTAEKDGFTGQLRTLTLNFKVKLVPNDKGENESAPDFRLQAAGHDFGAAWKKTSEAGRDYLSVAIDDPSFPATVYARLIEGENDTHDLIWSRSKPKAA